MHAAGTAEKETSVNIEHRWHANERADTKQPSTTTRNGTANRKTRHAKAVPVENNTAGGLNHIVNNITAPRDKWPGSLKETSTCPVQRPQLRGERITQGALGGNLKPAQLPVMGEWGGGGHNAYVRTVQILPTTLSPKLLCTTVNRTRQFEHLVKTGTIRAEPKNLQAQLMGRARRRKVGSCYECSPLSRPTTTNPNSMHRCISDPITTKNTALILCQAWTAIPRTQAN